MLYALRLVPLPTRFGLLFHRELEESPFVGSKLDPAVSYDDAMDVDEVEDPRSRLITSGRCWGP